MQIKTDLLFTEKIGVARMQDDDPRTGHFQAVQVALNNTMRLVSGNKLIDKVPVRMLSDETGIRSLNQMYAQDNLLLAWQNIRDPDAPISAAFGSICGHPTMPSRSKTRGNVRESARSTLARRNLPHTAIELWNKIDITTLRSAMNRQSAKRIAKKLVGDLPF